VGGRACGVGEVEEAGFAEAVARMALDALAAGLLPRVEGRRREAGCLVADASDHGEVLGRVGALRREGGAEGD
jgi:hypothetical protein